MQVKDGDQDAILLCGQFFTRHFCRITEIAGEKIYNKNWKTKFLKYGKNMQVKDICILSRSILFQQLDI